MRHDIEKRKEADAYLCAAGAQIHRLGESSKQIEGQGAILEQIEGQADEETNRSIWRDGEREREQ
jgi:hypothetical protein